MYQIKGHVSNKKVYLKRVAIMVPADFRLAKMAQKVREGKKRENVLGEEYITCQISSLRNCWKTWTKKPQKQNHKGHR